MAKLVKTSKELCKSCKYSKIATSQNEKPMCDYLCMTYMRRGCPVGWCDKYEKKLGAK